MTVSPSRRLALACIAGLLALAGCSGGSSSPADVDWPSPNGDADSSHFSQLADINATNVDRLGLAWSYDLGTDRVNEATPVVIDGVMYTSASLGRVYALDAVSGREIWKFEPEVDGQVNRSVCCDQANRGVAVGGGKVFVGALDGKLYALDAKSGAVAWSVDTIIDHDRGYSSTGAPTVAGDLVIIGNAGAEYDVRGYVTAYRIADGGQAWRFFTVPHDPAQGPQESPELEAALKSWGKESRWDVGGGGSAWDAINYDRSSDTLYIGVGNGGPYSHAARSPGGGDNLFLSSVVALDRKTGRMKWFYQETPQDSWDFTASQPMVLADLDVDGGKRSVILHSPKNGFLYVIDRQTGRPLRASPLVRQSWAKGVDLATGKPRLTPESSDYSLGPKIVFPASAGARNWYPPSWDANSGTYYASVLDMGNLMFVSPGKLQHRKQALNTGASLIFSPDLVETLPALPPPVREVVEKLPELGWVKKLPFSSQLRAIDPLTGRTKWAVDLAGWQDRGGVLATAGGLVFHGSVTGKFNVYAADSGKLLKSIDTGSSMLAGAMTYKVKGVQYVAIGTGWGGGGWAFVPTYSAAYKYGNANRILVLRLDGGAVPLPKPLPPLEVAPTPPAQLPGVTAATLARGQGLFFENCSICHSNQPRSLSPDLRRLTPEKHQVFDQIVLEGLFVPNGMPRWNDILTRADADAVHAWLIDEQGKVRERELELKKRGLPLELSRARGYVEFLSRQTHKEKTP